MTLIGSEPLMEDFDPYRVLVEKLQSGTAPEESFRRIFDHFYPPLIRTFERWGFESEDSLDLAQETLFQVFKSLPRYRGESQVSSWIYAIARNIYRNELRLRGAQKREGREVSWDRSIEGGGSGWDLPVEEPSVLQRMELSERTEALRHAVASLPEQMRRCVTLRINSGLKYREIAIVLGISIETVKAHLHQARKRLQESLGDDFDDAGTA